MYYILLLLYVAQTSMHHWYWLCTTKVRKSQQSPTELMRMQELLPFSQLNQRIIRRLTNSDANLCYTCVYLPQWLRPNRMSSAANHTFPFQPEYKDLTKDDLHAKCLSCTVNLENGRQCDFCSYWVGCTEWKCYCAGVQEKVSLSHT